MRMFSHFKDRLLVEAPRRGKTNWILVLPQLVRGPVALRGAGSRRFESFTLC